MYTLHEFATRTEGISYLLSAVILLSFIFFWLFLTDREPRE